MIALTTILRDLVEADMRQGDRSQRTTAALIGVDHSMLSRWLNAGQVPNGETIDLIVAYLGRDRLIAELRLGAAAAWLKRAGYR